MEELERIYVVPLAKAYEKPRIKRARIATRILRSFVSRHMKVEESSVKISSMTNSAIWISGIKKPPRRIKISAKRSKEGIVNVYLVDEKEQIAKAAEKKKKKEGPPKKEEPKKEEKPGKEEPGKKPEKKPTETPKVEKKETPEKTAKKPTEDKPVKKNQKYTKKNGKKEVS
ncbi:MAG: 50S ribosomal protein L31e [Candidatus Micrarchaeota archaeon]